MADQESNDWTMDSRSPISPGEERAARTAEAAPRAASNPGQLDTQQIGPALLVERFATFCKTCFIYPDNSQRVQVTGELVLDSLRGMFSRRPMVEIVVGAHDLVACGARLAVQSHGQVWLRDLLVKALIGGFEFTPAPKAFMRTFGTFLVITSFIAIRSRRYV